MLNAKALPLLAALAVISFPAHAEVVRTNSQAGVREVPRKAGDASYRKISGGDAVAQVQAALAATTQKLAVDAQIATFPYRANKIYPVSIKPGMFTTFTLPKDEPIKQFAVSMPDAAEISVNAEANVAMLKLTGDLTISATLVTDKRVYYMTISPSNGAWHQGVSWTYDEHNMAGFGYRAPQAAPGAATTQPEFAPLEPDNGLGGHPNFNYTFEGDAAVTPVSVWDNGRFTWIQFADNVQSLPAVFLLGPDGPEVVNYVVQPGGKQIKVNRLMPRFVLRLGSAKATVAAK